MNESTRKHEIWYYLWGGVPTQTAHTIYSRRLIFKNTGDGCIKYKVIFIHCLNTHPFLYTVNQYIILTLCLCSQEANWQFNALMFGKSTAKLKGKSDFNENKLCTRLQGFLLFFFHRKYIVANLIVLFNSLLCRTRWIFNWWLFKC